MRGQLDTAVGMILTITIVAATLTLAVWGFMQLTKSTNDQVYRGVYDALDRAASSYSMYGSRHAIVLNAPEEFCVFNLTATDNTCLKDYNGYAVCSDPAFKRYWGNASVQDNNLHFKSGKGSVVKNVKPANGRSSCFPAGRQTVFVEGHGGYVTISPMREVGRWPLQYHDDPDGGGPLLGGSDSPVRVIGYSSSATESMPEVIMFDANGADPSYVSTYYTQDPIAFGRSMNHVDLMVTGLKFDANGKVTDGSIISVPDQGFETPQLS